MVSGIADVIAEVHAARITSRNLTASFALLVWEICITFDLEVQHIWITPWRFWGIKTVYVFLRYYSLVSFMIIQIVATIIRHRLPIPSHVCRSFFLFQFISIAFVTFAADIIVMIRVCALYNGRRWVVITMGALFALEVISVPIIIPMSMSTMRPNFLCVYNPSSQVNIALSLVSLILVVTSLGFILVKNFLSMREGWSRSPVLKLVVRDGSFGVLGLVGLWLLNPLIAFLLGNSLAHVAHFWFMSIIPAIGCRVILNLYDLKRRPPRVSENSDIPLSSFVPISSEAPSPTTGAFSSFQLSTHVHELPDPP